MSDARHGLTGEEKVPQKKFPASGLLKGILTTYQTLKSRSSPTPSDVIEALTLLNKDCPLFEDQERLYREGILLNILYHANNIPAKKAKDFQAHEELKKRATSANATFTTTELEQKFLYYYKHQYFSKRTISALAGIAAEIAKKIEAEKAARVAAAKEAKEADEDDTRSVRSTRSARSVRSNASAASTIIYSMDELEAYATGKVDKLTDRQEYRMFRESYSILLALKKLEASREKRSKPPKPLTDTEFDLYKKILNSFIFSFSPQQSADLYNALVKDFKFDKDTLAIIEAYKTSLNKDYSRVLDENLDENIDIDARRKIIARMIKLKDDPKLSSSNRLLKDKRFDEFLEQEQEYRMFRETYCILLALKKIEATREKKGEESRPLTDSQFALYKKILNSFILGFSPQESADLYDDLIRNFGFDPDTLALIEAYKTSLAEDFPHVLTEKLDENIDVDARRKIIIHMITLKDDPKASPNRLLKDKRLDVDEFLKQKQEQEYRMFRENYCILLALKEIEAGREKSNEEPNPLTDSQFALYKKILDSFILGFSPQQSADLHNALIKNFGFDSNTLAIIEAYRTSLAKDFPHILAENLDENINADARRKIIIHMITLKDDPEANPKRLLKDKRLDEFLAQELEPADPTADANKQNADNANDEQDKSVVQELEPANSTADNNKQHPSVLYPSHRYTLPLFKQSNIPTRKTLLITDTELKERLEKAKPTFTEMLSRWWRG